MLRMQRPEYEFTYATLPPLFPHRLKTYSESLLRNIRAKDESTEERYTRAYRLPCVTCVPTDIGTTR
jgi:hypothetical protein